MGPNLDAEALSASTLQLQIELARTSCVHSVYESSKKSEGQHAVTEAQLKTALFDETSLYFALCS